ncbi:MAG: hypothetical protein KAS96_10165 [Planctomycetes bacterium]|nr:hypothetical protein [Planctomycetota bacterium]
MSIKEDKLVDYGGTALSVVSLLACLFFYPAVVAAYHSKGMIIAFGGGEACMFIRVMIFACIAGLIWGICQGIGEMTTKAEKRFGVIVLLLIYIPTFMPFVRIVKDIYK